MSTLGRLAAALARPVKDVPPVPLAPPTRGLLGNNGGGTRGFGDALEATSAVGTLYAIVNRLSTSIADTQWHLYRKRTPGSDPDAPREEITRHPVLDLLAKPNRWTTQQELFEVGQQHQELVGETALLVERVGTQPVALWNVRPDRLTPEREGGRFLSGWKYRVGQYEVTLDPVELLHMRTPAPGDPWRGLSPVASLIASMHGLDAAIRWNTAFFQNSASPGGVIEVDRNLSDEEFDRLASQWRTQHRGVSNAHRVAILEQGSHFNPATITQKDMSFIEGIGISRELIMEAFGMSKTMLGLTEDVNRATAETAVFMFAQYQIVSRLNRWRGMLNNDLLPMWGTLTAGLELDYDSPIPDDGERESAALTARSVAWKTLLDAGADPVWAAEQCGLPEPVMGEKPEPPAPPRTPAATPEPELVPEAHWLHPILAKAHPDQVQEDEDLDGHQEDWVDALTALLAVWAGIRAAQAADLIAAARDAATRGAAELAKITAGDHGGARALLHALEALWDKTATAEVAQMHAHGYPDVTAPKPGDDLAVWAEATADILKTDVEQAARRAAVQAAGGDAGTVADTVRAKLDTLTMAGPEAELGGSLTRSQGTARLLVMDQGPSPAYYASAHLDGNTCKHCRSLDGKWLGNTIEEVMAEYPAGQYRACEGGPRCRCQVVATYRSGDKETSYEKKPVTIPAGSGA